jgi:hypothetical protein
VRTTSRRGADAGAEKPQGGLSHVFAINVLAPYLLTALITAPDRLVYLSSGMHRGGDPDLEDLQWSRRRWNGAKAYSDSKLFDVVLAFAVARRWPGVLSNALESGWVPTKMGGPGAPDDWLGGSDSNLRSWMIRSGIVSTRSAARVYDLGGASAPVVEGQVHPGGEPLVDREVVVGSFVVRSALSIKAQTSSRLIRSGANCSTSTSPLRRATATT